jgi:hypothetical protein
VNIKFGPPQRHNRTQVENRLVNTRPARRQFRLILNGRNREVGGPFRPSRYSQTVKICGCACGGTHASTHIYNSGIIRRKLAAACDTVNEISVYEYVVICPIVNPRNMIPRILSDVYFLIKDESTITLNCEHGTGISTFIRKLP